MIYDAGNAIGGTGHDHDAVLSLQTRFTGYQRHTVDLAGTPCQVRQQTGLVDAAVDEHAAPVELGLVAPPGWLERVLLL